MIAFSQHLRGVGRYCWIGVIACDAITCEESIRGFTQETHDCTAPPEREHILQLQEGAAARGWSLAPEGVYCANCAPTHARPHNDRR